MAWWRRLVAALTATLALVAALPVRAAPAPSVTATIADETRGAFVRALAVAVGLPPRDAAAPSFRDVPPSSPVFGYVEAALAAGLIAGEGGGLFLPQAPLTRAEAARLVVAAAGAATAAERRHTAPFKDAAAIPTWAVGDVAEAASLGLMRGFPDGSFGPNQDLTVAEASRLVANLEAFRADERPLVTLGSAIVGGRRLRVLAAADGRTLYAELPGSTCTGTCLRLWRPLLAPPSGVVATPYDLGGAFGVVATPQGDQVTYDGLPLVTYAGDLRPGEASGAGVPGFTPATPALGVPPQDLAVPIRTRAVAVAGRPRAVLVDGTGATLYTRAAACTGACAQIWPPLTVAAAAYLEVTDVPGTFTVAAGPEGLQVEADGHPLYTFVGDTAPGEAMGQGFGGIWQVATPAMPPPPGTARLILTVRTADVAGRAVAVLATAAGRTLYEDARDGPAAPTCTGACADLFPPLLAPPDAVVEVEGHPLLGGFTLVPRGPAFQVVYRGHPLYTYVGDGAPGEAEGAGLDGVWRVARPGATPLPAAAP